MSSQESTPIYDELIAEAFHEPEPLMNEQPAPQHPKSELQEKLLGFIVSVRQMRANTVGIRVVDQNGITRSVHRP